MTISFSSSNLRDDATSGNGDYRLDKLPETTPSTSVFDRADVTYRQFTELHGQARDTRREAHVVELESKTGERARSHPCMRLSSSRTTALPGGTSHALSE
ncbi:transcriptional regulator [Mycobacterium tuberculosis]|nr:transcriptional regulator [Mycobacterium tuberculosis]